VAGVLPAQAQSPTPDPETDPEEGSDAIDGAISAQSGVVSGFCE